MLEFLCNLFGAACGEKAAEAVEEIAVESSVDVSDAGAAEDVVEAVYVFSQMQGENKANEAAEEENDRKKMIEGEKC